MCLGEQHTLAYQPVGDVGGQENPIGATRSSRSRSKDRLETIPETAGKTISSWSMESKIGSLSSCRSRLYASGNPFRVASSPVRLPISRPALPPGQLGDVGVLLLRHDARPGRPLIGQGCESNSWVTQMITSSLSRERSTAICAQT